MMKKIIILMVILLVGCTIHQNIVSQHHILPATEYEAAWSRAHVYCVRFGKKSIDIDSYTMFIDDDITLTRELHGGKTVLRYTTISEYNTLYPETIDIEKLRINNIDVMCKYITGYYGPETIDAKRPKVLR